MYDVRIYEGVTACKSYVRYEVCVICESNLPIYLENLRDRWVFLDFFEVEGGGITYKSGEMK